MTFKRWKKKCIEYSKSLGFVYKEETGTVNLNDGSRSLDEIFDFRSYDWCILGYPELKINGDKDRIIATYKKEEIRSFKEYKKVQDAIALRYKELMVQMKLDDIKADFV